MMKHLKQNCKRKPIAGKTRSGFTVVVALVLLTVIAGLSIAWAQGIVTQQRLAKERLDASQAEWLATSAIQRGLSQLAVDPAYTQETWLIPAEEFGGPQSVRPHGAKIEIRVVAGEEAGNEMDEKQIEVVVDYPDDPHLRQRVRRVQQVLVPAPENPS